ncbi:VOC family protein [Pseudomonadales bacterium]|nr:VOC family protein [Pseudomonadales bacterium]MDA9298050.1 VOC family protein [Pseudomonadales bacterium]MDB4150058.1 VOC family protein [Pseudomonadales bacterium]MDB9868717.1 VOC family protein [Pseudomonadales bacterium]MDB9879906.1 VOC family protein [Pseudomonadales bacterium]|tara:strand:- start:78 stop:833 length:756 start_codon:yes stop_codon:yes gene_type:complete
MRLRQVALVAEQLAPARHALMTLLGLAADYQDPGVGEFGLENSVMSIGDTFLEVVAPTQAGTSAGRLLQQRGGNGGYMVLLQVDDIELYREHTQALSIRKIWNIDQANTKAFHLHPKDMGATIVSLDWMNPTQAWTWGGEGWETRAAKYVGEITEVDIQTDDPQAVAQHWAEVLRRPVTLTDDHYGIELDQGRINFQVVSDGRGPGVAGLTFAVKDMNALRQRASEMNLSWSGDRLFLCGAWLRFVPATST